MNKILLISHGTIAKGVNDAVAMICGKVDNLSYLCLEQGDSIATFEQQFQQKIAKLIPFASLTVIADIKGGSPYTYAANYLYQQQLQDNVKIYSGLNLAMVLAAIESEDSTVIIETGKDAIDIFSLANDHNEGEL